jgi:hypothetical protein
MLDFQDGAKSFPLQVVRQYLFKARHVSAQPPPLGHFGKSVGHEVQYIHFVA